MLGIRPRRSWQEYCLGDDLRAAGAWAGCGDQPRRGGGKGRVQPNLLFDSGPLGRQKKSERGLTDSVRAGNKDFTGTKKALDSALELHIIHALRRW